MKKLLILLVSGLCLTGLLTACDGGGTETPTEPAHKHTFSAEWSFDEKSHWYAADCGHEMQANVAAHTDADNDGTCDICAYDGGHEHTFAEDWSFDETNHWHAATCNHAVKNDEAPHADTNNDSLCDGCGWDYGHEHTYASEWSRDGDSHWHAVTCGHEVEVKGKASHADENNDGVCDGCQWNYDHTHAYAEAWSHDTEHHWKDTTCGHAVISEQAPHADENNDGICDGCAWNYDHTHTYQSGDDWSIDDTNHWHEPTCGHEVEGIDQAAHVDADDDESCDVCGYDYNHTHTFDMTTWVYDKNTHYHAATCGHAVKEGQEAHKDADNDGICDVCAWNYDHTHEFSTEWTHDKTHHWHVPTCSHSVRSEEAAHADANNDGLCDTCAWNYDHTHTFDTSAWVIGANSHYYAPTCGHDVKYVRDSETKHEDKDRNDKCDTCGGYVSLELVVDNATADATASKVNGGTIQLTFTGTGYRGSVVYEFGPDYLHMTDRQQYSTYDNRFEYWYGTYGEGGVFAIAREGSDPYRNMGAEAVFMNGYYFTGEFVSYAFNCYGVEDLIYQLYGLPVSVDYATSCSDFMEFYDRKTDTYSFSYLYAGLYVSVSFKINTDFVITEAEIVTGSSPEARTNVITIAQTIGERTAVNPYDPDAVLISSYTIVDSQGNEVKDGDVINMVTGGDHKLTLSVKDLLPATANSAFDRITIVCSDESAMYTFAGADGNIILNGRKEGTYTVSFITDRTVKTITVNIIYPAPTTLQTRVYGNDGSYGVQSQVTIYLGKTLSFNAQVNENADSRYTAAIMRNGENGTLADSVIEILNQELPVTVFTPAALGDYLIMLTSVADPSKTATLVVHVVEEPGIEDILTGTWKANYYGTAVWEVSFTPENEGALKGTAVVTDRTQSTGGYARVVKTATFTYEYKADGLELIRVSGDEMTVKITITEDFNLKIGNFTLKRS